METVEDKVSAGQSEWLAIRHTNTAAKTERGRRNYELGTSKNKKVLTWPERHRKRSVRGVD